MMSAARPACALVLEAIAALTVTGASAQPYATWSGMEAALYGTGQRDLSQIFPPEAWVVAGGDVLGDDWRPAWIEGPGVAPGLIPVCEGPLLPSTAPRIQQSILRARSPEAAAQLGMASMSLATFEVFTARLCTSGFIQPRNIYDGVRPVSCLASFAQEDASAETVYFADGSRYARFVFAGPVGEYRITVAAEVGDASKVISHDFVFTEVTMPYGVGDAGPLGDLTVRFSQSLSERLWSDGARGEIDRVIADLTDLSGVSFAGRPITLIAEVGTLDYAEQFNRVLGADALFYLWDLQFCDADAGP